VLVIALLSLSPAIASLRARSLLGMLLGAIGLNCLFIAVGLGVSYSIDLPTGPTIILCAAGAYLLSNVCMRLGMRRKMLEI